MDKYQITVTTFDRAALRYQEKYMDVSLFHKSFDNFCDALTVQQASILELACGPGNVTRYLLTQRPELAILATDLAPNMLALGRKNCPKATFQQLDCRDISRLKLKFDGIMAAFCLPYLSKTDVRQLIKDAIDVLVPGGTFYLSTMEGSDARTGFQTSSTGEQVYIHYYSIEFLIGELLAHGFDIISQELQAVTSGSEVFQDKAPLERDIIIIAKRRV